MNPRLALVFALFPLSIARADGGPKMPVLIDWADHASDDVKRRLILREIGKDVLIVEAGSGVVSTMRPVGGGAAAATQLVACTKGTPGFPTREWASVALPCRDMSVIAAKIHP